MSRHPFFRLQLQATLPQRCSEPTEIPVERFGLRWSATMLSGTAVLSTLAPPHVCHIDYEHLVVTPTAVISHILTFFGLQEPSPDWLTQAGSEIKTRPPRWTSLAATEQARLNRVCTVGERHRRRLGGHA
jgi:hypothetical protein